MGVKLKTCLDCGQLKKIGRTKRRCASCRRCRRKTEKAPKPRATQGGEQQVADDDPSPQPVCSYSGRDELLRSQGFASYGVYLASTLWASIRLCAFKIWGKRCVLCNRRATQIHHSSYTKANLFGETVSGLHPVCSVCHRRVEFDEAGNKLTMANSLQVFHHLLHRSQT